MTDYVIEQAPVPVLPVAGSEGVFPVRRIYCVGRNYAAHAREMGGDPTREAPFFFCKPADAVVPVRPGTLGELIYPSATQDLHHEVELVVAIGRGGADIPVAQAQLNLMDSHDTARTLWTAGGDESALRLCTLLQMTMPGAPCIYYGDEIGMTGATDPFSRAAFL